MGRIVLSLSVLTFIMSASVARAQGDPYTNPHVNPQRSAEYMWEIRAEAAALEIVFGPQHARLRAARAAVASMESSASEPVLCALREYLQRRLAEVDAQVARLLTRFGERHPSVRKARARQRVFRRGVAQTPC